MNVRTKSKAKLVTVFILLSLFVLIVSSVLMPVVFAIPVGSSTSYLVASSSTLLPSAGSAKSGFQSDNLHWQFYTQSGAILFKSSSNGITWSAATDTAFDTDSSQNLDLTFVSGNVYLVWVELLNQVNNHLLFNVGSPQGDGSIVWDTTAVVRDGNATHFPKFPAICVGSDGNPWISFGWEEKVGAGVRDTWLHLTRADSWTGGTWTDTSGFPLVAFSILDTGHTVYHNVVSFSSGGAVYITYNDYYTSGSFHGRYCTASGWGSAGEETITSSDVYSNSYDVVQYNGEVITVFRTGWLNSTVRSSGETGTWGTEETVYGATIYSASLGILNAKVYCVLQAATTLIIQRYYDGAWKGFANWLTDLPNPSIPKVNIHENGVNNVLGVAFKGLDGTKEIRYAWLSDPSILSSVTSNSPANGTVQLSRNIDFNFTPVWLDYDTFIQNVTLYVGGAVAGSPQNTLTNNTAAQISYTLPSYAAYSWYVRLYNTTNYVQSETRYITTIASQVQSVTANSPAINFHGAVLEMTFTFTPVWTIADNYVTNATIFFDDGNSVSNSSVVSNNTVNTITTLMAAYDSYSWYVRLYNTTSYVQSATRTFTLAAETPPSPPIFIDPTNIGATWFLRSDTHTINGVLGYRLSEVESASMINDTRTVTGNYSVSYGFRAWGVDGGGDLYEITSGVSGIVTFPSNYEGEGLTEGTFSCSGFPYVIDAVKVIIYQRFGTGAWSSRVIFMSNAELLIRFPSDTWSIYYYIARDTSVGSTISRFSYGISPVLSSIAFEYSSASPWEIQMYWLLKGKFFNFMVTPWTFYLGDAFYGIILMFFAITTYNRYQSMRAVLGILWIFGGAGGLLSLMIPAIAMRLAWVVLALATAITLYKLFR